MMNEAEQHAESDKERRSVIEAANQADSVCADTEKALKEFGDKVPAEEKEEVTKLVAELRELAVKAQSGDDSIKAEAIKDSIGKTQQKSLGLFAKVRNIVFGRLDHHHHHHDLVVLWGNDCREIDGFWIGPALFRFTRSAARLILHHLVMLRILTTHLQLRVRRRRKIERPKIQQWKLNRPRLSGSAFDVARSLFEI